MSRLKKPVQVLDLDFSDNKNATLQARYIGKRETTASGGTLTIDNNGDDGSKLLITAVGWDASADAAKTKYYAASAYTAGGTDTTVCTTLQALIDAINGDDIGFEVRRNHGMSDLTTNSDDFLDIAATQFSDSWTNFLFRDEGNAGYQAAGWSARCGVPNISGKSRIEILKLVGTGTYAAGSIAWKVSNDRGSAAADEVELYNVAGAATTVEKEIFDYSTMENPPVVSGPLAVELIVTTGPCTAATAKLLYRPLN